ncbi:hypothetical protein BDW74DRAFT_146408 [Aspergillus multicolor]|uniref:uncharacterized protein n=1 Tax=Aspergillus multicolor TaxID=41759 RepID=UPI003CCDEFF7
MSLPSFISFLFYFLLPPFTLYFIPFFFFFFFPMSWLGGRDGHGSYHFHASIPFSLFLCWFHHRPAYLLRYPPAGPFTTS